MSRRAARRLAAATTGLALTLCLGACVEDDPADVPLPASRSIDKAGLEPTGASPSDVEPPPRLGGRPDPTPGVVEVDGAADALTVAALAAFARSGTSTAVRQGTGGETRGFERLCLGDVDVVDSSRPITAEEYDTCRRNGLDVVQLQVAADAVVLAVEGRTDVGADCLSTGQVRAVLGAGSEVTSWSQLGPGFDDVRLAVGGPTVADPLVQLVGRVVLDRPAPIASDLRADYRAARAEGQTLGFTTGSDRQRLLARELVHLEPRHLRQKAALQRAFAAWSRARAEVTEAVARQREDLRGGSAPGARAASQARVARARDELGRRIADVSAARAVFTPDSRRYQYLLRVQALVDAQRGHLGLVSHGVLLTTGDRLRPFEVDLAGGEQDCVLPTAQTILSGDYPLSRPLLLTVTTRSLRRPEVRGLLLDHVRRSQALAAERGVVPLPDGDVARQVAWLEEESLRPRFGIVDGTFGALTGDEDADEDAGDPSSPPTFEVPAG